MDLAVRFETYADDFDRTVEDDDWLRIRKHFAKDAIREEHNPPVISLRHEGIDMIINEWRTIVENFDRLFDRRVLVRTAPAQQNRNVVTLPWVGIYVFSETPTLIGEGREIATYKDDRITHLRTTWSEDTIQRMIDWASRYANRVPGLLDDTATLGESPLVLRPQRTSAVRKRPPARC